jgi:hypothetical protein
MKAGAVNEWSSEFFPYHSTLWSTPALLHADVTVDVRNPGLRATAIDHVGAVRAASGQVDPGAEAEFRAVAARNEKGPP